MISEEAARSVRNDSISTAFYCLFRNDAGREFHIWSYKRSDERALCSQEKEEKLIKSFKFLTENLLSMLKKNEAKDTFLKALIHSREVNTDSRD